MTSFHEELNILEQNSQNWELRIIIFMLEWFQTLWSLSLNSYCGGCCQWFNVHWWWQLEQNTITYWIKRLKFVFSFYVCLTRDNLFKGYRIKCYFHKKSIYCIRNMNWTIWIYFLFLILNTGYVFILKPFNNQSIHLNISWFSCPFNIVDISICLEG